MRPCHAQSHANGGPAPVLYHMALALRYMQKARAAPDVRCVCTEQDYNQLKEAAAVEAVAAEEWVKAHTIARAGGVQFQVGETLNQRILGHPKCVIWKAHVTLQHVAWCRPRANDVCGFTNGGRAKQGCSTEAPAYECRTPWLRALSTCLRARTPPR